MKGPHPIVPSPRMTPREKIMTLIGAAEGDRAWHKSLGHEHGVEAMACSIRLIALRDALACLPGDPAAPTPRAEDISDEDLNGIEAQYRGDVEAPWFIPQMIAMARRGRAAPPPEPNRRRWAGNQLL